MCNPLEPRLLINCRTIVVRRVNKLILIFAKVDRIILYAPEISAPPVEIVIITVGGGIIPVFLDVFRYISIPSTIISTLGFFASTLLAAVSATYFQLFASFESFHIAAASPSLGLP